MALTQEQKLDLVIAMLKYAVTLIAGLIVIVVSALAFLVAKPYCGPLIAGGIAIVVWPVLGRLLLHPTRNVPIPISSVLG